MKYLQIVEQQQLRREDLPRRLKDYEARLRREACGISPEEIASTQEIGSCLVSQLGDGYMIRYCQEDLREYNGPGFYYGIIRLRNTFNPYTLNSVDLCLFQVRSVEGVPIVYAWQVPNPPTAPLVFGDVRSGAVHNYWSVVKEFVT